MNGEFLVEWNPWWGKEVNFNYFERDLQEEILKWVRRREVIGLLGVRRSGKTTLMYLIINFLLKSGVRKENILFIKADDNRVSKEGLIQESIDSYKELMNPKGRVFVFIDEVQEIKEWSGTLKRFYDLNQGFKFFVSGSNSSMLKEDLSFKLAGRVVYFELFPFSFKEFLKSRVNVEDKIQILSKKNEVKHFLLEYLEFGGFPEIIMEKDKKMKNQLLIFYYDTIIYRDVVKRRKIRFTSKIEKMINFYLQNVSKLVNFTKVGKQVFLSTDTVVEYTKFLQDAFFIFYVPIFDYSVKKQEVNPKKIYCVDSGLRNAKGFKFSNDFGKLYENTVFIELKRKISNNPLSNIFYWKGKNECDFLIKKGNEIIEAIQVVYDLNEENKQREINGLIEALEEFNINKGLIITRDYEGIEEVEGKKIEFVPLWKWLLKEDLK